MLMPRTCRIGPNPFASLPLLAIRTRAIPHKQAVSALPILLLRIDAILVWCRRDTRAPGEVASISSPLFTAGQRTLDAKSNEYRLAAARLGSSSPLGSSNGTGRRRAALVFGPAEEPRRDRQAGHGHLGHWRCPAGRRTLVGGREPASGSRSARARPLSPFSPFSSTRSRARRRPGGTRRHRCRPHPSRLGRRALGGRRGKAGSPG